VLHHGIIALVPVLLLAASAPQRAARQPDLADDGITPEVFRRFAGRVVKVEVSETGSAAKAGVGSAFFAAADGRLVTNYHVIAQLVQDPERYRAVMVNNAGDTTGVRVLAIDVVHDLAVITGDLQPAQWFALGALRVAQGQRLYSLGHPLDEGIAIVEGTYNGNLPHTLYPRIRFTGAINPGMSGGPAITVDGRVVGVNVSTAGNELGYLVPVDRAAALLELTGAPGYEPPADLLGEAGAQIRANQERYLAALLRDSGATVTLGRWRLPTQPAEYFDCWADAAPEDEHQPYGATDHFCSTNDDIFVSADQSSGVVEFEHQLITSTALNRFRFYALYTGFFHDNWHDVGAGPDEVTGYRCRTGHVRKGPLTFATVFCVRRYRKLNGLYDAVFRLAALGEPRRGLLTTLTMSGVTFANAREMARRYVERIGWTE
jgi:serine protease Do